MLYDDGVRTFERCEPLSSLSAAPLHYILSNVLLSLMLWELDKAVGTRDHSQADEKFLIFISGNLVD